jgi:hypothetical protein
MNTVQMNTLLTMPNNEYRKYPAVSQSELKEILRSPLHYKYKKENPKKSTDAMELGTMFHKALLEPETVDFVVMPKFDKRTKEGKENSAKWETEHEGKDLITEDQFALITNMLNSVKSHSLAGSIFDYGLPERSVIFDQLDIECKARFDWLRLDKNVIVDVKTTVDARPEKFKKHAYDLGYHVQAYWYSKAYEAVTGKTPKYFIVVVESVPPHGVIVYQADPVFLELGGMDAREMLLKYQECQKTGIWEGYEVIKGGTPLTLPSYIK